MWRLKFGPQLGKVPLHGKQGIVLGHKISRDGIEVHQDKIQAIEKLPTPILVRGCKKLSWSCRVL